MNATRIAAVALFTAFVLGGCSNSTSTTTSTATVATTAGDAANSATASSNGITLRASVVTTGGLQETVARGYGIERLPDQAMLLLSVRDAKGDNATPVSLQATVSDLKGNTRPLPLREIRTGDLVDRIGLVPLSPPDTLTFEVRAQLVPGSTSTVRVSRDFYPIPVN